MQITIFGASGKVGSLVVEEALRRGHSVTAFVHSKTLTAPSGKLAIIKGDVYDAGDVTKALNGSAAVVSCLGSWGTPKRNVLTAAMGTIIPAMNKLGVDRIVTLTGNGAVTPDKPLSGFQKSLLKLLQPFPVGKVFQDGVEHMRLLAQSDLRWTTVRSPVMNNFGRATYRLNLAVENPAATIRRQAVANAILDVLEADSHLQQAPVIHRA